MFDAFERFKRENEDEGRKELVWDMLDYMADDFQDMMRAKKWKEEEALGIQRFPRGMDAEIERRRKEERCNRKKKKASRKLFDGKPPLPAINKTNIAERGILKELTLWKACRHFIMVLIYFNITVVD